MQIKMVPIADIIPYENNPRKNDKAVDAVAESIRQCGYVAPIIIDEEHIILAGHTRYKALLKLGWKEADVVIRTGLTEEQKRKYRILDNKTSEFAEWDFDKLQMELEGLDFGGFDFDLSSLDNMARDFNTAAQKKDPEPVFTPEQVVNTEEPAGYDPYLPEPYNDEEIQQYTEKQEEYVAKRRVIITFAPEYEADVKAMLGIDGDMKIIYDYEELAKC